MWISWLDAKFKTKYWNAQIRTLPHPEFALYSVYTRNNYLQAIQIIVCSCDTTANHFSEIMITIRWNEVWPAGCSRRCRPRRTGSTGRSTCRRCRGRAAPPCTASSHLRAGSSNCLGALGTRTLPTRYNHNHYYHTTPRHKPVQQLTKNPSIRQSKNFKIVPP